MKLTKMKPTPKVISRADAMALGLVRFFTGNPCVHGHVSERLVSDRSCMECRRLKAAAHHHANADEANAARRARREINLDAERAKGRECRERNIERERARSDAWRKANPEWRKAYIKNNAGMFVLYAQKRRARKLNATPAWDADLTDFVMREATDLCRLRGRITGIKWEVDHMIPLRARRVSGLHVWNNLQVIPAKLNRSKRNSMVFTQPHEWVLIA